MKKIINRVLYAILFLVAAVCIAGLILAYWPTEWKIKNKGVTPEEVAVLRQHYTGPHNLFTTSDGEILFIRRWDPGIIEPAKKNIAILIFHGFTAYSGPYTWLARPYQKVDIPFLVLITGGTVCRAATGATAPARTGGSPIWQRQ